MVEEQNSISKTEFIAFASGKGGTGKTLMASCLGYALIRAGHRVLMVDTDQATDGLSLFILGPKGMNQITEFTDSNTFAGMLKQFQSEGTCHFEPRQINRTSSHASDHGVTYEAIISGKGLYGDIASDSAFFAPMPRQVFQQAVATLFSAIRETNNYDYVLVDTRGGFGFDSSDICALADSFIVVTDPDVTSFYQDRNLVKQISATAEWLNRTPVLRAIIVNRAIDGLVEGQINLDKLEVSFRLELEKAFPLKFTDTHAIPADIEVLKAYKSQRIPYLAAPASLFSFATLSAFGDIMRIVTARWTPGHIRRWNNLVATVSKAIERRNSEVAIEKERQASTASEITKLREENIRLQQEREKHDNEAIRRETKLWRAAPVSFGVRHLPFVARLLPLATMAATGLAIYSKLNSTNISWGVIGGLVATLVSLSIVGAYFTYLRPVSDQTTFTALLLNQISEDISKLGSSRGIRLRTNIMLVYRPILATKRRLKTRWASREMRHSGDAVAEFGVNKGVAGQAFETGRDLFVNMENPDNLGKWGFSPRETKYFPKYTMIWSFPIYKIDKNGNPTGRIVGVLNLDSLSENAFEKITGDDLLFEELRTRLEDMRDIASRAASM